MNIRYVFILSLLFVITGLDSLASDESLIVDSDNDQRIEEAKPKTPNETQKKCEIICPTNRILDRKNCRCTEFPIGDSKKSILCPDGVSRAKNIEGCPTYSCVIDGETKEVRNPLNCPSQP